MADRTDLTINDILNGCPVGVLNGLRAQAIRNGFASQNQALLDAIGAGVIGALLIANNLSDVADPAASRVNLGSLQTLTEINVLVAAAIAAAGHLEAANDLSDVADAPTVRTNLDVIQRIASVVLGDLVTQTASGEIAGAGVKVDDAGTTTAELLTAAEVDIRLEQERRYAFMVSGS